MSLKRRLASFANRLLAPLGAKVDRAIDRTRLDEALQAAVAKGLAPRTVIDVGVAYGTPELYAAFPTAQLMLIEPLREWEPGMRELAEKRGARYVIAAAGATPGTAVMNVPRVLGWATMGETAHDVAKREVRLTTVDEQVAEQRLVGPFVLKVDVEGFEPAVLAGAADTLPQCDAVILETWLDGSFTPLVATMAEYGFVAHDLFEFGYRASDGVLTKVDVMFVKAGGPLRETVSRDNDALSIEESELRHQGKVHRAE